MCHWGTLHPLVWGLSSLPGQFWFWLRVGKKILMGQRTCPFVPLAEAQDEGSLTFWRWSSIITSNILILFLLKAVNRKSIAGIEPYRERGVLRTRRELPEENHLRADG